MSRVLLLLFSCSTLSMAEPLSAGAEHSCRVFEQGVQCWGDNRFGQLGDGSLNDSSVAKDVEGLGPDSGATAVSVGRTHTCALQLGGVKCWGANGQGQLGNGTTADSALPVEAIAPNSGVSAVAAGDYHSCAVQNGALKCWGSDSSGQLGNGMAYGSKVPTDVAGLQTDITAVAAGANHTCAVQNGGVKCWGSDNAGQLGNGATTSSQVPGDFLAGLTHGVTALAAGREHSCALQNGGLKCWGSNRYGQLGKNAGFGTQSPGNHLPGLSAAVSAIAAGAAHTCAIHQGALKCWGQNIYRQLGDDELEESEQPLMVEGASNAIAVAAGERHTCYLAADNEVYCWGAFGHGLLGDGRDGRALLPVPVQSLDAAPVRLAAGDAHTCAFVTAKDADTFSLFNKLRCWGSGEAGQLGQGSHDDAVAPVTVIGFSVNIFLSFDVATARHHSCAVLDGALRCWGGGAYGELGHGKTQDSVVPVDVVGMDSAVLAVTAGAFHTCALRNGALKCWGLGGYGQLGDGVTTDRDVPVTVTGLDEDVTAVAVGHFHTCAIHSGGVKCWGLGSSGQLGYGGTANSKASDSFVPGLSHGVKAIAVGAFHSCALHDDGAVWCWGQGDEGQLGTGDTLNALHAAPVAGLGPVLALAAGAEHTCAIVKQDHQRSIWCWGKGLWGGLGNGTRAVQVGPGAPVKTAQGNFIVGH